MYTERVVDLGYSSRKSSWWQRQHLLIWQRIHIHKFTYGNSFRVHAAIHLVGFDPIGWLNGIHSYSGWYESPDTRRYTFSFTESSSSWQPCVDDLYDYTRDVLIPWFDQWTEMERLINDRKSPLTEEQKLYIKGT
jgi:hypothetical protein